MRICKVKNCGDKNWRRGYCRKHYRQILKYGKILNRNKFDKNKIIDCCGWYEICLYNIKQKEIARALIDKDDLNKIKNYKWCLGKNGYVIGNNQGKILLHQLILGKKEGYVIDHISHNELDNRKQNLRFATMSQNSINRKNVKGYCWYKLRAKWKVEIGVNCKKIHLGYFINKQDAIEARKQAELKYHGEFTYNQSN